MTGEEFYRKRMDETNWPRKDLCDPPTDPRTAMHILIDHFLGEKNKERRQRKWQK